MRIIDLANLKDIGGSNPQWRKASLAVSTVTIDLSTRSFSEPWPFYDKEQIRVLENGVPVLEGIVTKRTSRGSGDHLGRSVTISDYWYYLEYTPVVADAPDWSRVETRPEGNLSSVYPDSPYIQRMGRMDERNAVKEGANKAPIAEVLRRVVNSGISAIPWNVDAEVNIPEDEEMVPWSTALINYGQLIRKFMTWRPRMSSHWDYTRAAPTLIIDVPGN